MSDDRRSPFRLSLRSAERAERSSLVVEGDLAEWAELCLTEGYAEQARLLFEVAALRSGFSPQSCAAHRALGERLGLATSTDAVLPPHIIEGTTQLAIAELRAFALAVARQPRADGSGDRPAVDEASATSDAMSGVTIAEIAHDIFDVLSLVQPAPAELQRTLSFLKRPMWEVDGAAMASLPLLATRLAAASLQDFSLGTRDLLAGPLGSADLFHRAARFDSFGLGPYFGNVRNIVRNSGDVLELARIAAAAASDDDESETAIAPWFVLVSRTLDGALFNQVIDELGDRDNSEILDRLLTRIATTMGDKADLSPVTRIRDAALDNGDHALARRAQRIVVDHDPTRLLEWMILGEIEATAGDIAAAEERFRYCLSQNPDDREAALRLAALRSDFTPYVLPMGFGSPEDRRLNRLRRRRGAAANGGPARISDLGVQVNY